MWHRHACPRLDENAQATRRRISVPDNDQRGCDAFLDIALHSIGVPADEACLDRNVQATPVASVSLRQKRFDGNVRAT
ncbi:MAG: hypothetical protein ACK4P5_05930 [Fimbriimonadales bacterium]